MASMAAPAPPGGLTQQEQHWKAAEANIPLRTPVATPNVPPQNIEANYFACGINPNTTIHRYSITIGANCSNHQQQVQPNQTPNVPQTPRLTKKAKRALIEQLLASNPPNHNFWACDYDSLIISAQPLYGNPVVGMVTPTPHPRTGSTTMVTSTVTYIGVVDTQSLQQWVNGNHANQNWDPSPVLKALNIITYKFISGAAFQGGVVGKKFYPQTLVNGAMEANRNNRLFTIRRGFFSSMRAGDRSVFLNVNNTTSAFYTAIGLDRWMWLKWGPFNGAQGPGFPNAAEFQRFLRGVQVTFNHSQQTPRRQWKIFSLGTVPFSAQTFANGVTSVETHLRTKYPSLGNNPTFPDPNLRCVNVGSRTNPIWYPMDCLTIVDWQPYTRTLDSDLNHNGIDYSREMLRISTMIPSVSKPLIERHALPYVGFPSSFNIPSSLPANFYQLFGLAPQGGFAPVRSVVFPPPRVVYRNGRATVQHTASWDMRNRVFHTSPPSFANHPTLDIIYIGGNFNGPNHTNSLIAGLRNYGVFSNNPIAVQRAVVNPPANHLTPTQYRQQFVTALDTARTTLENSHARQVRLIMVVLPRSTKIYAEVKRWGDCIAGLPTVCVDQDNVSKLKSNTQPNGHVVSNNPRFVANLCMKFNLKLGGQNHTLRVSNSAPPGTFEGFGDRVMFIGADVTHPGRDVDGCPSIACVVATDGHASNRYLGSARLQTGGQEYISDLEGMIRERLLAWHSKAVSDGIPPRERWPRSIVFYRDGVSESQYGMVLHKEFPQIQSGWNAAWASFAGANRNDLPPPAFQPSKVIVVVTKRHHTRLSRRTRQDNANLPNLPSGTLVDSTIVSPSYDEFYLQSHHSALGTARCTHNVILENTSTATTAQIEKLTNDLCWSGSRALCSLSVCTPARYADLLCTRMRAYLKPTLNTRTPFIPQSFNSPNQQAGGNLIQPGPTPAHYAADTRIWAAGQRRNPWHQSLENVMFYL